MRSVKIALAAGLTILAGALGVVLSHAPIRVVGANGVPDSASTDFTPRNTVICEDGGTVPRGTQAIRVSLSANNGPRVAMRVLAGRTIVSDGVRDAGWGIDETVTVPVARMPHTIRGAHICVTVGPAVEPIQINGIRVATASGAHTFRLRMEYLRPGPSSWFSLASVVTRHMGIAHAPSGSWVAYLMIAVMIAVCALASGLVLRELR